MGKIYFKIKANFFLASFFVLTIFLYFYLALAVNENLLKTTTVAYYNHLISSFSQGRLDISPGPDLSFFNNKWYPYWGPAPVIAIYPFYLLFRHNPSDIIYTLFFGLVNVLLFYFVLKQAIRYFRLNVGDTYLLLILANFAFASPNLYLSLSGRIWHSSQIISIFYLLFFLYFYFLFLNNRSIKNLIISAVFFNLAWFSRLTLVFYGFLFFYPFFLAYKKEKENCLKEVILFIAIFILFISLFFGYNFLRFSNILETGLRYHLGAPKLTSVAQENGTFSLKNIKQNFKTYFMNNLSFSFKKPYVKFDPEGNGIFFVYPILILLLFSIFKKRLLPAPFLICSFTTVISIVIILLLYFSSGWTQFGCRYFLDVIPLLFLLVMPFLSSIPKVIIFVLTAYGAVSNFFGSLYFYNSF